MSNNPELVVMLTHNDLTVSNALEVFAMCQESKAKYWGFKEAPLPLPEMKRLVSMFHQCGKTAFLEVVSYSEAEGLEGARIAVEIGCDILMGTKYFAAIHDLCKKNNVKYMPFVGTILDRPSILTGAIDDIIQEGLACAQLGVDGIDLLGYRYVGDAADLITKFVQAMPIPVCVAGSIDSYQRLDLIKSAHPWSFTIGSAFFDNRFPGSFCDQVNAVCDYMHLALAE